MKMTKKLACATALYAMRTAILHAGRAKDAASRADCAASRADDDDGYAAAARIHADAAYAHADTAYAHALIAAEAADRVHTAKTPVARNAALALANDAEADAAHYAQRAFAAYHMACDC